MDFIFVFAILITVTGAQENQLEGPQNTLSVVGSTVTLKCSSPSRSCNGIDWQKYVPGSSPITVFKSPGTILDGVDKDRYSVNCSSGCDLVIRNTKMADAGRFICSAIISTSQKTKSAYLIMLETPPNCALVTSWPELAEGDGVQLKCSVTYNGTNSTSMVWKEATDAPTAAVVKNRKTVSRSYFVNASAPEVPSFTCIVTFSVETADNGVIIQGLAPNSQNATCETPIVKVLSTQLSRVEEPQNTLSVVGSNVTLKCLSERRNCSGIEWLKYISGNPMTVYNNREGITNSYSDRYSINSSTSCKLIIRNVQLTDAGLFICKAAITPRITFERAAYLTILETQPTCSMYGSLYDTIEGEGVQLNCMIAYNDRNTLSMVWTGFDDAPAGTKSGSAFSWSYYVNASASEIPSFTCSSSLAIQTKNSNGEMIIGLARNVPNATCATPAIKVLHTVRDVQLSPSSSNYSPGSRILCMSKGYPAPTLHWQEMENGSSWKDIKNWNGLEFTMNNVSDKRYRCVAMNVVRSKEYYATSHEFLVNKTASVPDTCNNDILTATPMDSFPLPLIMVSVAVGAALGFLLFTLPINCFLVRACPGYKWCHSGMESQDKIREGHPLVENPDLYCSVDQLEDALASDKPRSAAPTSEPPSRPNIDLPRTSTGNPKDGRSNP